MSAAHRRPSPTTSFADDVLASTTPVLVDFWATWCGPCRMVAPVLEEIAAEKAGSLTVAKIDVDANPSTARDYQVVSIPTLILFKDGKPVKRIVGRQGQGRVAARDRRRPLEHCRGPATAETHSLPRGTPSGFAESPCHFCDNALPCRVPATAPATAPPGGARGTVHVAPR